MKIIVTMAGEGSRFKNIGFSIPKHEIIAKDKTLFEWSLLSLEDFFDEEFILIVRRDNYDEFFIEEKMKRLGIKDYSLVEINYLTDGQAETALLADRMIIKDEEVVIYNIDTYVEMGEILKKDIKSEYSGFIPSFKAKGENWSFVKFTEELKISEVSEKVKISDYGTVGFYYFKSWGKYKKIYEKYKLEIKEKYKEVYIAPMYEYLIEEGENIYGSIVGSKKIHILGTPEDIEYFDYDYLEKQEDIEPYKRDLLNRMEFDKLDDLYERNIQKYNKYIPEYILYLADTGRLLEIKEICNNFDMEKILKKYEKNKVKKKLVQKFIENDFFSDAMDKRIWYIAQSEILYAYEIFKEEKRTYLSRKWEIKNYSKTMLVVFLINRVIEEEVLEINIIRDIMISVLESNMYNVRKKKYLFVILYNYAKEKNIDVYKFKKGTEQYNLVQPTLTLLCKGEYENYKKGIKRYLKELRSLYEIKSFFKSENYVQKKDKPEKKIAVCISGIFRWNYIELLEVFKEKMVNPLNADVYIFTWDKMESYPGFGGPNQGDDADWSNYYFQKIKNEIPREIKKYKDFKKKLPNTAEKLKTPEKKELNIEEIKKIFKNVNIVVEKEENFPEMIGVENDFVRRGNYNQAKMFYGISKSIQMATNNAKYEYIIRCRPDWIPLKKNSIEKIEGLGKNELGINLNSFIGPTDLMFYGAGHTMGKFSEIWEIMMENKTLSPFYSEGKNVRNESHALMELFMRQFNFIPNTDKRLEYETKFLFSQNLYIPDFSEELEKDLLALNDYDKAIMEKIFSPYNVKKKSNIKESSNEKN